MEGDGSSLKLGGEMCCDETNSLHRRRDFTNPPPAPRSFDVPRGQANITHAHTHTYPTLKRAMPPMPPMPPVGGGSAAGKSLYQTHPEGGGGGGSGGSQTDDGGPASAVAAPASNLLLSIDTAVVSELLSFLPVPSMCAFEATSVESGDQVESAANIQLGAVSIGGIPSLGMQQRWTQALHAANILDTEQTIPFHPFHIVAQRGSGYVEEGR